VTSIFIDGGTEETNKIPLLDLGYLLQDVFFRKIRKTGFNAELRKLIKSSTSVGEILVKSLSRKSSKIINIEPVP
jgi:hypothetical protein